MSVPTPKRLDSFVQMAKDTAEQMATVTETPPQFASNRIVFRVESRLMPGYVPTPEEVAAWALYDEARPKLDGITDPVARAVLDLHAPDPVESPKCWGCDMDGYECEPPEWPCRTVEVIAKVYGIELPAASYLWRRP